MNMRTFDLHVLAERLKALRTEKGVGQNELAKELELSNASISYWENAKQEPSASANFGFHNILTFRQITF